MTTPKISVITCTYIPEPDMFRRVVESVAIQKFKHHFEHLIIDNSKDGNLALQYSFIQKSDHVRIIHEPKPGLTNARLCGAKNAKGELLIFVDDDNELDTKYLQTAYEIFMDNPKLIACGPGNVDVIYLENNANMEKFKGYFQESHLKTMLIGRSNKWEKFCPPGTGLIVRKELMAEYANLVETEKLSSKDRTGSELTSGGDAQIVLLGMKMGYNVGKAPALSLKHLIEKRKSNADYIAKMMYGVYSSGFKAEVEIFPENKGLYKGKASKYYFLYLDVFRSFIISVLKVDFRGFKIKCGHIIGEIDGYAAAADLPQNRFNGFLKNLFLS